MTMPLRRFLLTTGVAFGLATAAPVFAQDAGFAVEIAPPADAWAGVRIGLAIFGETVEPAAGYVRGCAGHVPAESAGARIDVTDTMETLTLTVADPAIVSLVLGSPDGLYRCVLPGPDGLISARIDRAGAGRYQVWLGGAEAGRIDARMILADRPISAMELRGLDVDALGPPRTGRHEFDNSEPRQVLATSATVHPDQPMDPLSSDYCAGYSRFDAADAVLTLTGPEAVLSVFAMSGRDLTIAVRAPDGRILCNDDSFGLNPAVSFRPAPAGDYHVFVGAFSQGGSDVFDLFASPGSPSWDGASVDIDGTPRQGHIVFDRDEAGLAGQLLASGPLVPDQPMERLPGLGYCPGYTGIDAPDAVMTLDRTESMISLYALSGVDLVLAVRAPDGQWYCNDDSFGLNPAVSIQQAPPGDYQIWVAAYSQGNTGRYNLYASMGEPNWQAADAGSAGGLNPEAEPAIGRIGFGPETRIDPRLIFDIAPSQIDARGMGEGCVGYITPSQPDLVVDTLFGLPQLMVYMVSEADGVLLVVGPDGQVYCNDDFEGLNPGVMIPNPQPGPWAVFAGTYGGSGGLGTLGVTIANPLWVMDREH